MTILLLEMPFLLILKNHIVNPLLIEYQREILGLKSENIEIESIVQSRLVRNCKIRCNLEVFGELLTGTDEQISDFSCLVLVIEVNLD